MIAVNGFIVVMRQIEDNDIVSTKLHQIQQVAAISSRINQRNLQGLQRNCISTSFGEVKKLCSSA